MSNSMLLVDGTSESLRQMFSVRDAGRVCFVDSEPGEWGNDEQRYLASHECEDVAAFDAVVELWADPDTDPSWPWHAFWYFHQPLNNRTIIKFCPHCGVNLDTLFDDPFRDASDKFERERSR